MTDQSEDRKLPVIVEMVGGAALEVLQWPDHVSFYGTLQKQPHLLQ